MPYAMVIQRMLIQSGIKEMKIIGIVILFVAFSDKSNAVFKISIRRGLMRMEKAENTELLTLAQSMFTKLQIVHFG